MDKPTLGPHGMPLLYLRDFGLYFKQDACGRFHFGRIWFEFNPIIEREARIAAYHAADRIENGQGTTSRQSRSTKAESRQDPHGGARLPLRGERRRGNPEHAQAQGLKAAR